MSFDGDHKQWMCGKSGTVNLHRVSSIVRDIGEPCLHQSPIKIVATINKMLKPEKWQTTFDSDGKVLGFQKALKLIMLGGVDPSIRPEVWEFLLGCYTLSSTADYRRRLRTARRVTKKNAKRNKETDFLIYPQKSSARLIYHNHQNNQSTQDTLTQNKRP
nr:hypothetical protein [Tanacetum cinerariifolium]